MAAGYIVAQYSITDHDMWEEYSAAAGALVFKHGGKTLVVENETKVLDGNAPGKTTVALECESMDAAQGWYDSPEYQEIAAAQIIAGTSR